MHLLLEGGNIKLQKTTRTLLSFCIILFFLIGFVCAFFGKNYNISLLDEKPRYIWDDIYITDCDNNITNKVTLPYRLPKNNSGKYKISTVLDKYYNDDTNAIAFKSHHMSVDVLLDDCYIYSHRFDPKTMDYSKSNGVNFHLVDLDSNYYGKLLTINIETLVSDYNYVITPISIGSKYAICTDIFTSESVSTILIGVNVILVFICLVFTLIFRKSIKDRRIDQLSYVSMFMIFYTISMFFELSISDFIVTNTYLRYFLKCCSIMVIYVPILFIYKMYCNNREKRILDGLIVAQLSNFFVQTILNFAHIKDYVSMLSVTPIINTLGIVFMGIVSLRLIFEHKKVENQFFISMVFLLLSVLFDGIWVFTPLDLKICSQVCVIVFAIIQIIIAGRALLDYYKMGIHSKVYENLALTDNMTTLSNRLAFDRGVVKVEHYLEDNPNTWCFVIDINNLKQVNDTLGHQAGDDLITYVAQILILVFSADSKVFRIGGDEFVVIMSETNKQKIDEKLDYLNQLIEMSNSINEEFMISVAVGYDRYNSKLDKTFDTLFERADKLMYQNKIKVKTEQGIGNYR